MDLFCLSILQKFKLTYDPNENYIFLINLGEKIVFAYGEAISYNEIFVLPETSAQAWVNSVLWDCKVAVIKYFVRGEERPWS